MERLYTSDLICAEATPSGRGGVSIIRVSGEKSEDLFQNVFFKDKVFKPKTVYFKKFYSQKNIFIDDVVVFAYTDNNSFTGEPSFEIQCHGSPLVVESIIRELLSYDVRMAEPGEFSYRSYLNGKMDLVQAEGVHHLILSKNNITKNMSLNLLSGGLSNELNSIKDLVVLALSRLEALIDFSDQDIDLEQEELITNSLASAQKKLTSFVDSFNLGESQAKGIKVALVGPPNAGKSSLFNRLLFSDRSIVSSKAGTTRDYVSEIIHLDNECSFELIDTAGLRLSSDEVESEGIERGLKLAAQAQLVLFLVSSDTLSDYHSAIESMNIEDLKRVLVIKNKIDLKNFELQEPQVGYGVEAISTFSDNDISLLKLKIKSLLSPYFSHSDNLFVKRHFESLSKALLKLDEALKMRILENEDIISSLLYTVLSKVDEVLHIDDPEEVRNKIFSDFCLGK